MHYLTKVGITHSPSPPPGMFTKQVWMLRIARPLLFACFCCFDIVFVRGAEQPNPFRAAMETPFLLRGVTVFVVFARGPEAGALGLRSGVWPAVWSLENCPSNVSSNFHMILK